MELIVTVTRVVDPGPPAVLRHRSLQVQVPEGVPRTEAARVLARPGRSLPPSWTSCCRPAVWEDLRVPELRHCESVVVARPSDVLYELVSDVTRTGEWSPICKACWWDEGDGPQPGSWFTGRNVTPDRVWETRSLVTVADPGREFTFVVGGSSVRWSYTMEPVDGGTRLTETWEFLPAGLQRFAERYGDDAPAQIAERTEAAHRGMPVTLAAIKRIAEAL